MKGTYVLKKKKNMFCPPIQSFDNQTSEFTRPLENVLAPLYKNLYVSKSSLYQFVKRIRSYINEFRAIEIIKLLLL